MISTERVDNVKHLKEVTEGSRFLPMMSLSKQDTQTHPPISITLVTPKDMIWLYTTLFFYTQRGTRGGRMRFALGLLI